MLNQDLPRIFTQVIGDSTGVKASSCGSQFLIILAVPFPGASCLGQECGTLLSVALDSATVSSLLPVEAMSLSGQCSSQSLGRSSGRSWEQGLLLCLPAHSLCPCQLPFLVRKKLPCLAASSSVFSWSHFC
uniref:Uncharacterized protein n=1 Tax=Rousettus aegyptiacus TaxID=9407 RepID=A0A7J8CIV1_ROUAE|nr:hypothetical protein HJG63_009157 [Rousettus aegyptiacus]